nr:hypothetical protein BaRGS_004661 [Batillaria attramentaria]
MLGSWRPHLHYLSTSVAKSIIYEVRIIPLRAQFKQTCQGVSDLEPRHEPAMTEEELCKSAPTTQHPLDFIQHQLQQLQQRYRSHSKHPTWALGGPPTGGTITREVKVAVTCKVKVTPFTTLDLQNHPCLLKKKWKSPRQLEQNLEFAEDITEDTWTFSTSMFNPLQCYLAPLGQVGVLSVLLDWTMEGLDQDKAMQQPEGTFKVRHLKMGIALATSLLQCSPSVAKGLITRGVQYSLLNLLESPYMAFSIRLQILKALDASLRFPDGVRCRLLECLFVLLSTPALASQAAVFVV